MISRFFLNSFVFQSNDAIDAIVLFESIFYGFWALILVFVACETCEHFSGVYDTIYEKVIDLDWYRLPLEMQQTLVIVMIESQKPLPIQFFGSITCGRELFKQASTISILNKAIKFELSNRFFQVMTKCYNTFMVLREVLQMK